MSEIHRGTLDSEKYLKLLLKYLFNEPWSIGSVQVDSFKKQLMRIGFILLNASHVENVKEVIPGYPCQYTIMTIHIPLCCVIGPHRRLELVASNQVRNRGVLALILVAVLRFPIEGEVDEVQQIFLT